MLMKADTDCQIVAQQRDPVTALLLASFWTGSYVRYNHESYALKLRRLHARNAVDL